MKNRQTDKLSKAIERLEISAQKIIATRGYSQEPMQLKLLSELLKEQLRNENPHYSTRPVR